jgi:preprotein translocase subunit Sss1
MDAVVIGSIAAVVASIIVFIGFLGYWIRKIMNHPPSHN